MSVYRILQLDAGCRRVSPLPAQLLHRLLAKLRQPTPLPPPAAGFAAYQAGDWPAARAVFQETVASRTNKKGQPVQDGPSATLLRCVAEH